MELILTHGCRCIGQKRVFHSSLAKAALVAIYSRNLRQVAHSLSNIPIRATCSDGACTVSYIHEGAVAKMSRRLTKWLPSRLFSSADESVGLAVMSGSSNTEWSEVLPMERGSHGSAKVIVTPASPKATSNSSVDDPFQPTTFRRRLEATVASCRELRKSSLWVYVPMQRCSLIEQGRMLDMGFRFHHATGDTAVLNKWLEDSESKIPEYATHVVGAATVVVNSRDEILCVRELRKNYLPWKTPTGLLELGENIEEGAVREVFEETGIRTTFHSVLGFRHAHGAAHGRSDTCFICRLDPIEGVDENGNRIIPQPIAQESEIERVEWVPLSAYREMVAKGHPMMSRVLNILDGDGIIDRAVVESVVPGRQPSAVYYPSVGRVK